MEIEGLDFKQTLELLAQRAGVELESETRHEKSHAKDLYDVMNLAAKFFSDTLQNPEGNIAREYAKRRLLTQDDFRNFSLGYSPNSWDSLTRFLKNSGVSEKQILDAGLAIQNQSGGIYDRFRGRLIFPVKDISGRVIAFGGRLIDGDGAKYINSPESQIYTKRRNLYLLNDARNSIRKKSRAILVEGYMDALRLHKSGFQESIASLGTSLTPEQAELLARFSDTCYICYDSDLAGQEATIRGMYILQEHGLAVRVISIPEGKDPDEFLCANEAKDFETLIADSQPLILHHLEFLREKFSTPGQFRNAEKSLLENLSRLRYPEIEPYNTRICAILGVSPDELHDKLREISHSKAKFTPEIQEQDSQIEVGKVEAESEAQDLPDYSRINKIEAGICALLWNFPELRTSLDSQSLIDLLGESEACDLAVAILTYDSAEMNQRWLLTGEVGALSVIAQGENFLREISSELENLEPLEKWQRMKKILEEFRAIQRIQSIREKMLHERASYIDMEDLKKFF